MKNVEDIYPLSPMQELMLLHATTSRSHDVLFNQFCYSIHGNLDVVAFERAWRQLVRRHPTLRTAFVWQDLPQPLQVVRQEVDLPFEVLDWRSKSGQQLETDLAALKAENLRRGFKPSVAPLMRITLIHLNDDSFQLIWSSHHLLLDRWCLSIVMEDLVDLYDAERSGQPPRLGRATPFRNYISWIQKQNPNEARTFWRRTIRNFSEPTLLSKGAEPTARGSDTPYIERLSEEQSAQIRAFARSNGLTISTMFHGAWALLINQYTERQDVLFGTAVAGRPPDLVGIDSMVGSFINNIPIRISLPSDRALSDWLRGIQNHQQDRVPFEYVSLAEIQRVSAVAPNTPLFDSILVWLAPVRARQPQSFQLREMSGGVKTTYPLTVTIADDDRGFEISVASTTAPDPAEVVQRLRRIVTGMVGAGDSRLAQLSGFASDPLGEPTSTLEDTSPAPETGDPSPEANAETPSGGRESEELDALQTLLVGEWGSVLGTTEIGVHDNFFDLGGNSLLATRLHAQIEAALGRTIPMMALFHASTVEQMATALLRQDWPLQQNIARPVRPRGSRPPLFCVASPEVNTIGYAMLSRHLDDDQPVIVLQSPPGSNEVTRLVPDEMPAVAASYIEAMTPYLTGGPIRLIGMCGGAHIALEMGNQLHAQNRVVDFIGLVNTWSINTLTKLFHVEMARSRAGWYLNRLRGLIRLSPRELLSDVQRVVTNRWHLTKEWFSGNGPADAPDPWHITRDEEAPAPVKFPGMVTVLRIRKQQFFRPRDPLLGWGERAEQVQVRHLPGKEHLAILREPDVRSLAAHVTECLGEISHVDDAPTPQEPNAPVRFATAPTPGRRRAAT